MKNKLKNLSKYQLHQNDCLKLLEGSTLIRTIENISKQICDENKKYEEIRDTFKIKNSLTYPFGNHKVKNIQLERIKIKNSATKPLIIPFETQNGPIVKILYKKEDVRKDQLIMNLFILADSILKKEEKLDTGLVIYNILPTGKQSGIIEIVDDCETIYHIQQNLESTILNYILEYNGDSKVKDVRDIFIKSTAAYCVLTYLFGVGDRHLDNIMITNRGQLFHIDFGYIFGNDPILTNPCIRITPEIIETLGGLSSKNYTYFVDLCSRIYNCLRKHIDIFITMSLMLPKITNISKSENEILDLLINRFLPGESQINSKLHLVNQLEKQNYVDKIKDWCHYHSKEKTVCSAMNRLTSAVTNLIHYTNNDDDEN